MININEGFVVAGKTLLDNRQAVLHISDLDNFLANGAITYVAEDNGLYYKTSDSQNPWVKLSTLDPQVVISGMHWAGVKSDKSTVLNPQSGDYIFDQSDNTYYVWYAESGEDDSWHKIFCVEDLNIVISAAESIVNSERYVNGVKLPLGQLGENATVNAIDTLTVSLENIPQSTDVDQDIHLSTSDLAVDYFAAQGSKLTVVFEESSSNFNNIEISQITIDDMPIVDEDGNNLNSFYENMVISVVCDYTNEVWRIVGHDTSKELRSNFAFVKELDEYDWLDAITSTYVNEETFSPKIYDTDVDPYSIFKVLSDLATETKPTVHFLKYNNCRCKFDIISHTQGSYVRFTFIYDSNIYTVTITEDKSTPTPSYKISYLVQDLVGDSALMDWNSVEENDGRPIASSLIKSRFEEIEDTLKWNTL